MKYRRKIIIDSRPYALNLTTLLCVGSAPLWHTPSSPDTTSAGGDAHVSYGLSFQLVFYSRDGVVTLTDSIDANPAFGDCSEPANSIQEALREVTFPAFVKLLYSLFRNTGRLTVAQATTHAVSRASHGEIRLSEAETATPHETVLFAEGSARKRRHTLRSKVPTRTSVADGRRGKMDTF